MKIFHETFQEGRFGTWKHALKKCSCKYDDLRGTVAPYPTKHANMQGGFCDRSQEGNDLQMGGLAKALQQVDWPIRWPDSVSRLKDCIGIFDMSDDLSNIMHHIMYLCCIISLHHQQQQHHHHHHHHHHQTMEKQTQTIQPCRSKHPQKSESEVSWWMVFAWIQSSYNKFAQKWMLGKSWRGLGGVRFLGVFGCLAIDGSAKICVRSSEKNHASHRLVKQNRRRLEQRTWLRSCFQVEKHFYRSETTPLKFKELLFFPLLQSLWSSC